MYVQEIKDLPAGKSITGFFLVKAVNCKTTQNNAKYLDILLGDKTGELNAKLWDCSDEDERLYLEQMLVKVKGTIGLWQGRMQLKIERIRPAQEEDGLDIEDFVPVAPEKPEVMFERVLQYINEIRNKDIKAVVGQVVEETKDKLMYYPAAKQNHHSVQGGLLYHILTMLTVGEKLSEIYSWINRDLLYGGIILHDIAKVDEMDAGPLGMVSDYSVEGQLLGHIVQGIKRIDRTARKLGVAEEVSLLLQHMVLSHHYEPEFGSPKRPMIPEAELLHYIDIIDARMYDMAKNLENTSRKEFSDKVWVLHNRRLYKSGVGTDEDEVF
ncbi:MAG: 3'-5' exoribonuclease YhaM family protein [Bacillota bacterium]